MPPPHVRSPQKEEVTAERREEKGKRKEVRGENGVEKEKKGRKPHPTCLSHPHAHTVSHLEMVLSWFMDFSTNLGKTSVFKYQPQFCAFP